MRWVRGIGTRLAAICGVGLVCVLGATVASGSPTGGQAVQGAWLFGPSSAWVWTQDLNGPVSAPGPQGVERTSDGGASWSNVTPPGLSRQGGDQTIGGLFALNAQDAWVTHGVGPASSNRQEILATTDGGRSWRAIGAVPNCGYLDFVSRSDGWCAGIDGAAGNESVFLYRTTTGGRSWRLVYKTAHLDSQAPPGGLPFPGDKVIAFTGATVGWAAFYVPVGAPELYETVDGGSTWIARRVSPAPGSRYGGGGFLGEPVIEGRDGAVGYSLDGSKGTSTVVYVTDDGGTDWRAVVPPGPPERWYVDVISARSWRLFYGDRILETRDAGATWQTLTTNHAFPVLVSSYGLASPVTLFGGGRVGWVVQPSGVGGGTLWRTVDAGARWYRVGVPGT